MMSYNLETVVNLYKTKFTDFFVDFTKDDQKSSNNHFWFMDKINNITSIHYNYIDDNNHLFQKQMKKRFDKIDEILNRANEIAFVSNRNEDIINFVIFLFEMNKLYSGNITYINIRNNNSINGIKYFERTINGTLKLIEYEFNDIHSEGNDPKVNSNFWIGKEEYWQLCLQNISINNDFKSLFEDDEYYMYGYTAHNRSVCVTPPYGGGATKNRSRAAPFVRFFSATFFCTRETAARFLLSGAKKRQIQPERYTPFALKLVRNIG